MTTTMACRCRARSHLSNGPNPIAIEAPGDKWWHVECSPIAQAFPSRPARKEGLSHPIHLILGERKKGSPLACLPKDTGQKMLICGSTRAWTRNLRPRATWILFTADTLVLSNPACRHQKVEIQSGKRAKSACTLDSTAPACRLRKVSK